MSRRLALDITAAAVIVIGGIYLWLTRASGSGAARAPELPILISDGADGRHASIDLEAWQRTFEQIDLPDPPLIRGADPVPIERLAATVERWAQTHSIDVLGEIGAIYLALEEHEMAAACFAAAADLDSADPRWIYFFGAECQKLGLNDRAADALRAAIVLEPRYPTSHARLGALHLLQDDLDGAEAAYREYVRIQPQVSLGHRGLGDVALRRGRAEQALRHLVAAVQATPNDYLAYRFLARALAATGRSPDARRAARTADSLPQYTGWLSFDERLRDAHALARTQRHLENTIRLEMAAGRLEETAALMREILDRRPEDAGMRGRYAAVCAHLGRMTEAVTEIEQAVREAPQSATLRMTAAEIALNAKDYEAAAVATEALVSLDPLSPRAYDLRGRTRYTAGDVAGAISDLEVAVTLGGPEVDLRIALAAINMELERYDEAIWQLDQVLDLQPEHGRAREMMTQVAAGLRATCPSDVNLDKVVDTFDLWSVIAALGQENVAQDVNGSGVVDAGDLAEVLRSWGSC